MPDKTKPRGRPEMSAAKRAKMRARISQIAGDLFKANGFGTVSMRRIAKDIGCTPMALYSYYDSKLDILRSLWSEVFQDLFEGLERIPQSTSAREYLASLAAAYVDYWLDHPEHYRLVFMAEGVTQPDVSLFLDNPDIIAKYTIFSEAIQRAGAPEAALKSSLDFFLSALHGIAHNHITISGYEWSTPREQISYAVSAVTTRQ